MSKDKTENVQGDMPKDAPELTDEELALPLEPFERQSAKDKKNRRRQSIIGMIAKDPHVSLKMMSEKLNVNIKTIWRDLNELKSYGVIERIGDEFTGEWKIIKKEK
jgi:ATP-dependent DNA helicase RecG